VRQKVIQAKPFGTGKARHGKRKQGGLPVAAQSRVQGAGFAPVGYPSDELGGAWLQAPCVRLCPA